jgi:hypothetical protein
MSDEPRPEGEDAAPTPGGEALSPEPQEWASPGWSPPAQTPQTPATPSATPPGYPPPATPPGYQAPAPGYPPQYGQTPPPGYPPPAPPPGYQTPPPGYPPQGAQTPPPGEGWYPQQPHYAPGWQAPVGAPPAPRGRGPRIVLTVIAGLAAVALVVGGVIGGRYWLETRPLGEVTKPMTVHAGRLGTGHCLASLPADGTVRSVRVVPCSDPHVAEVVGSRPLSGPAWPGDQQVTTELEKWCEMDTAEHDLGLRPVVWGPTEQGWHQGDRTGLCLAWLPSGTMTGSFVAGDSVTVP